MLNDKFKNTFTKKKKQQKLIYATHLLRKTHFWQLNCFFVVLHPLEHTFELK